MSGRISVPVDVARMGFVDITEVRAATNRDGEVLRDFNMVRKWHLFMTRDLGYDFETIKIEFAQDDTPGWSKGSGLGAVIHGLNYTISPRKNGDGYWMNWVADAVEFINPKQPAKPAGRPNGELETTG